MTTYRIKLTLLAAVSCLCLGPTGSAWALDYDEAVSGDLNETPLGDLGPGRNTIRGSVDGTAPAGPDGFTFNVPTGRQLIGATFEVSNYQDPLNTSPNVNTSLGAPANGGESIRLASGSLAMDGSFMFAATDPLMPFPYPAGNGYSSRVNLSGTTGGATADWEMGIITAGPTRNASIDPGAIGSTFQGITRSTSVFNGNNFDGDGFVLNTDLGGKALRYSSGDTSLAVFLDLIYEGDALDASLEREALGIRFIGADGSEDHTFTSLLFAIPDGTSTPGLSMMRFAFIDLSPAGAPDGFTFSGVELIGLLPTDARAIVDAELTIDVQGGNSTSLTVVPEPGTAMALLGLGTLCVMRRRRA